MCILCDVIQFAAAFLSVLSRVHFSVWTWSTCLFCCRNLDFPQTNSSRWDLHLEPDFLLLQNLTVLCVFQLARTMNDVGLSWSLGAAFHHLNTLNTHWCFYSGRTWRHKHPECPGDHGRSWTPTRNLNWAGHLQCSRQFTGHRSAPLTMETSMLSEWEDDWGHILNSSLGPNHLLYLPILEVLTFLLLKFSCVMSFSKLLTSAVRL